MAKVRSNNGGNDPNKVTTKDYKKVYNDENLKKLASNRGDHVRQMAEEMKKDLGNDKLPRARYGTAGHQEAVRQSNANTAKRTAENHPKKYVYKK